MVGLQESSIVASVEIIKIYEGLGYDIEKLQDLPGYNAALWSASIDLSGHPQDEFIFDIPTLVYSVRYHEAKKQMTCNWTRQTFEPGKTYNLCLKGESSAKSADGSLPNPPEGQILHWELSKNFTVATPDTLRPYIHYATLGDNRIFSTIDDNRILNYEKLLWNPTVYAYGFPAYKKYLPVVGFKVQHMDKIFPNLNFQVIYDNGNKAGGKVQLRSNIDGDTYLADISKKWIEDHCGKVEPDQEIVLDPLPSDGTAKVQLSFSRNDQQEIKLDEWTCHISRFDSFKDHLSWYRPCVTVFYGPRGKLELRYCPPISDSCLNSPYAIEELDELPDEWHLPPILADLATAPLDKNTGYRFCRFAAETGARFNTGNGDAIDGINDTVKETTIQAIMDNNLRVYALWLRTPEPVDWRRVTATLEIIHLKKRVYWCPRSLAYQQPLDLKLRILPSPDATSAFLIGIKSELRFDGSVFPDVINVPIRLPRGQYRLKLTFDQKFIHLPHLRPSQGIDSPEEVLLDFIQPLGGVLPSK